MGSTGLVLTADAPAFRHEAFLYRGDEDLLTGLTAFVRDSLAASEPVLVALARDKTARLREELRDDVDGHGELVMFADITEMGRNPSRIIPACRDFVRSQEGRAKRIRTVGEPLWAGRSDAEKREAQRHEALISLAFTAGEDLWMLCPYDVTSLPADVIDEAYRSHPYVLEDGFSSPSRSHQPDAGMPSRLDTPLPDAPPTARTSRFGHGDLSHLRRLVGAWADDEGMPRQRRDLLVLAVNELTTNSIEHGGGAGSLLLWTAGDFLVAEVRDAGHITAPLVGRVRPDQQQGGGRGVWLVNQVCDLVQLRSHPGGTVVRVHMSR